MALLFLHNIFVSLLWQWASTAPSGTQPSKNPVACMLCQLVSTSAHPRQVALNM